MRYGKRSSSSSALTNTATHDEDNQDNDDDDDDDAIPSVLADMARGEAPSLDFERSVGPKVDHAALLRTVVGNGCPVAVHEG